MFSQIISFSMILFCCCTYTSDAWRLFRFNHTSIEVIPNPVMANANGSIRRNAADHTIVDMFYEPKVKILGPILGNVYFTSISMNMNLPIKINMTIDVCELFKNPRLPPIINGIYKDVISHMDMPLKCPIQPKMYHILGIGNNEDEFPPYLPLGMYRLFIRLYLPRKNPYSHLVTIISKMTIAKNNEKRPTRPPKVKQ